MDINRRQFILFTSSIAFSTVLSGCVTRDLVFKPESYIEEISSVLISSDNKTLVFMTKDYHYIFDTTPNILSVLKNPLHRAVQAGSIKLTITGGDKADLSFVLRLNDNPTDEIKNLATQSGFTILKTGQITSKETLKGRRYQSGGIQPSGNNVNLNKTYKINVSEYQYYNAKLLLTPITLTVDGALFIGGVGLFAAVLPVALILCLVGKNSNC